MDASDLRTALTSLGITQADLARLLRVTPRGVNLWFQGERDVPGPVAAYLSLLLSLPRALQVQEFGRLTEGTTRVEGLYSFAFQGSAGAGIGALVLMSG
ncbi:helix-turn-helix domain-containing protein, partial [Methylobacterium brachiatum]